MMKKTLILGIIGLVITISAAGLAYGATVSQPEPAKQSPMMNMDADRMNDMMKNSDTQQQCVSMMKNTEMQQSMMQMMRQPEMQAAMKQMLQKDAGFHQMMLDLVNSVDINAEHANADNQSQNAAVQPPDNPDHAAHHQ